MSLEEKIRNHRKQAGLSQEKMAEQIGVSRQAVTKWENGTGTPDIANLMAVAELFGISEDELLSDEKAERQQAGACYESRTEYDIDRKKNFDIHLGGAHEVLLSGYEGEKIVVLLQSESIKNIQSDYKVRIDDIKNRIDVDVNRTNDASETDAKEGLSVKVLIPRKYAGKIELETNAASLEVADIENESVELGGRIGEVILNGCKSEVEIDSNLDMRITVGSHEGSVEVNQISATSRITVPEGFTFRTVKKGIATNVFYETKGERTEDFSQPEAENRIELSGLKSELVIVRG